MIGKEREEAQRWANIQDFVLGESSDKEIQDLAKQ